MRNIFTDHHNCIDHHLKTNFKNFYCFHDNHVMYQDLPYSEIKHSDL